MCVIIEQEKMRGQMYKGILVSEQYSGITGTEFLATFRKWHLYLFSNFEYVYFGGK